MCISNSKTATLNAATAFLLLVSLSFPGLARGRSVGVEPSSSGGYLQSLICLSLDFLEEERYVYVTKFINNM